MNMVKEIKLTHEKIALVDDEAINGRYKHLGYFVNEIDAHNAYVKALNEIGEVLL
jgi:hypothetical protein